MDLVTFNVIVDDIVYPDGHTCMACLGGGGPQTAFGAKIWADDANNIGIASRVGSDFPFPCKRWLQDMGIDLSGLLMWSSPTLRAWQILELDGSRTQVWRITMGDEVLDMLRLPLSSLPMMYRNARVYHIGVHPSGRDVGFIKELRSTGAEIVSVETYTHALDIVTRSELIELVSSGNIFSSNEKEAASLVGPGSPMEMIERITELGAEVVTLRRGPFGSIVHRSDTRETWEIPAFHAICASQSPSLQGENTVGKVVDPTGCGNTFCGAFAMGWWKTRDLLTSGLWGSVAASFMAEYEGVPPPQLSDWRKQAQMRLDMLRPYAKNLFLPM
ncbi:uncharacterized protein C16C9.01c [Cryptomeria japonica]|uniref:uncharacterized protein C16C9.01c n=1 Tax=Cryptomeria japonica TaxID=3369 RepID=UPI0027DAA4F2|nr:uncharacterized protein C16C9.01c [Cryptomeria japonica]